MKPFRAPGWLTGTAIAAVAAVNLAGLWGIAMARQGAIDEARRAFGVEITSRATALESRLSGVRADLAFLGGSPTIARLAEGRDSPLSQGAVSALLLFMRGRIEVVRVVVRAEDGEVLTHVVRRGGVPIVSVSARPTGEEGAAVDPTRPRLTASLPRGEGVTLAGGITIETEVEASALLDELAGSPEALRTCVLADAHGAVLARRRALPRQVDAPPQRDVRAQAPVRSEGWSLPSPLVLACSQPEATVVGLAEPVWARYRTTFVLNAGVMVLALLLGGLGVQQARRRARLEARAAEESRVRELERQLFHAERLTTVGRLAAGIAHEINNPLEGMSNYLTLARDALGRGDTEAAERHVSSVRQGLDRAAGIVRQVLAHADPAKAPTTPLDLNGVLRETEGFVQSRREFAHIRFDLDLADGELLVRGSPVMLGQVAVNLILNACEVQPDEGEVRVSSRREDDHAIVDFADRGPGIAEADRPRVFEPFFSTRESTGLGLSICHTIVKQHEGELTVHAREGGGSLFRMKLPALTGAAEAAPGGDGAEAP
jgi:signal transduction histidine kinase